jgi:hypothetical protein
MRMPRTVFDAGTPQHGRAKQRTTILNLLRGHAPLGGMSAADAMPTSDRRRAASNGRIGGGAHARAAGAGAPALRISARCERCGVTAVPPLQLRTAAPWCAQMGHGFREGCAKWTS